MDEFLHNEKIMNYLDGLMNADEKSDFESQLKQSPELQQQLADLQIAIEAVRQFGTKERVGNLHREMIKELKPQKSSGKIISMNKGLRLALAVAAGALLILVGVQTFKYFGNTPGKLYNEAFVDYSLSAERGIKETTTKTEELYRKGEYSRVINSAGNLNLSARDSFLIAVSFLKNGDVPSAIKSFNQISAVSPYYNDAEFYLSLAYLKNKNYRGALDLATKIHNDPNHPYHSNISDEWIEKLRKLK
jgi:TolA-binding protein